MKPMIKGFQAFLKNDLLVDIFMIEIIAIVIVIVWFHQGLLYGGGEAGLPFYNLDLTLKTSQQLWQNSYLGFPSIYQIINAPLNYILDLFYLFGVPGFLIQASLHFLLFSTGMISMYFLLKVTIYHEFRYRALPLFGSIFYFLNLYSMSQIWARGLYMQFIPFASFPLMLLLLELALSRKKIIFILLMLLISYIFSAGFTPAYVLSFWLLIGLVFIYHFFFAKRFYYAYKIYFIFFNIIFRLDHYPFLVDIGFNPT